MYHIQFPIPKPLLVGGGDGYPPALPQRKRNAITYLSLAVHLQVLFYIMSFCFRVLHMRRVYS